MADREERHRRSAARHETLQQRVGSWLDRNMTRKGMRPRYAAYLVIAVWLVAIIVFGIVQRLADPGTFPTIWLAWWWAIQTVTTVGYGDVVPGQVAGKAVAAVMMVGGLSFLSILTATITSAFIARRQERARDMGTDPVMRELNRLSAQFGALTAELERARLGGDPAGTSSEGGAGEAPGPTDPGPP
jgi:voltage-gated potassium channel